MPVDKVILRIDSQKSGSTFELEATFKTKSTQYLEKQLKNSDWSGNKGIGKSSEVGTETEYTYEAPTIAEEVKDQEVHE
jgi:hypothetical protein